MKMKHDVKIAGIEMTLNSENAPDYVEKLTTELTRRINALILSSANVTKVEAAIVCALDLLDENYRLKLLLENSTNEANKNK